MKTLIYLLVTLLFSCSQNGTQINFAKKDSVNSMTRNDIPLWDSTNVLNGKTQSLKLDYIVWGCACANWITFEDYKQFADSGLADHCIFIEPVDSSLAIPDNFVPLKNYIKVSGQFYLRKGYSKGTYLEEEPLDSARIFRYNKLEILNH